MKKDFKGASLLFPFLLSCLFLFIGCGTSVRLTASWSSGSKEARLSKILVMAIGKDLEKRTLGETSVKKELQRNGIAGLTSIEEFGPDFARQQDSIKIRQALLSKQFDGILTIRVLDIHEHDRWVPGDDYYGPISFYHRFYSYYYKVWKHYINPGYFVTDVEVLLESNLYRVSTGVLLWSGQSKAFSRNPTPAMAARYAKNIVEDMLQKGAISR
ncbi:hypothetical protein LL912_02740 [Niabella sp. CC-SYL272]|uniref:hypothetical protein n=1 Tax=Niabella agricola TaxID=2891571 RepID=UPI001F24DE98|nr:hypothetical protein [Niabella agricola]MCF3107689.1 hypothetical protein [Niabella agricola]